MIAPLSGFNPSDKALLILQLEDSTADQRLTALTLRRAGWVCRIDCVDRLEDFQAALAQHPYDLILADYHLPGFTAMDAWAVVREQPARPPFVLLSGAIGETAAVDAIQLGVADYLLKENMARLPHVLQRALEVHRARLAAEQAQAELRASQQQLAALTEHLQTSIEQERAAIAREIHDDIGGALTAVKFDLSWLDRNSAEAAQRQHIATALEMLQHALGASQRIMMNLRPPVLDQGLVAAVQWLCENFERRTGIPVRLQRSREHIAVSDAIQLVAYRTAQEALTNISKYAQASQVAVDLSDQEGVLTLEVTDNGCGMAPALRQQATGFGLRGLQERARTVDGWLDISSQPGKGTSIIVSIPLP